MQKKDFSSIQRGKATRKKVMKGITYTFLGFWALAVLFPFYWMVLTSLKSYSVYSTERIPQFITLAPTIENYLKAFTDVPLGDYFGNTLIFSVATTALMLFVTVSVVN